MLTTAPFLAIRVTRLIGPLAFRFTFELAEIIATPRPGLLESLRPTIAPTLIARTTLLEAPRPSLLEAPRPSLIESRRTAIAPALIARTTLLEAPRPSLIESRRTAI
jgi:hypothetical protein